MSVVDSARKLIRKPYVWGGNYPPLGTDNGTDCSGLCQWAYHDIGINISRTTHTQVKEGMGIINMTSALAGDLLFTNYSAPNVPEHVAMYAGKKNGVHYIVEAQDEGIPIHEIPLYFTPIDIRRIINDKPIIPVNKKWGMLEWLIYT